MNQCDCQVSYDHRNVDMVTKGRLSSDGQTMSNGGETPPFPIAMRWFREATPAADPRIVAHGQNIIPSPITRAYPQPIRAPKRDHDEWLVRGRSGGSGVVPVQVDPTGGRSLILGTKLLPLPLCEGAARIGAPSQRASRRRGCSHRPGTLSPALAPQLPPRSVTGGGSAAKVAQPRMETP
jgi:hypothetical protein